MASSKDLERWEFSATWTVAAVCSLFVVISLLLQRGLHHLGKILLKKKQQPLYEALQKLQEELMLLGFISLLLTVFQGPVNRICIPESYARHMLPCKLPETKKESQETAEAPSSEHESHSRKLLSFAGFASRQLLSSGGEETSGYCEKKGKKPFVSTEGLHQLHIFIFVLAIVHVLFCVFTMLLGSAKMRMWKAWEREIQEKKYNAEDARKKIIHVIHNDFVKTRAGGIWRKSAILRWVACFFRQFYGSMTKADYSTLRLCFIETHCKSSPEFNFYKYILRTLEADFKKVVGISGYLWFFVVLFLLLNINGWNMYFWIAFLPLILSLSVGAKLECVIGELAQEVLDKHAAVEEPFPVRLSDEHFWFGKPELVLYLIHFILFQNAFEIAFFFWILTTYGFNSCIIGKVGYIIPRLVIGVVIQVLCSFSTLPLYALVTQMGTRFKKTMFEEHIHEGLSTWHRKVRMKAQGKPKRLSTWHSKVKMKPKEKQTNRPVADSDSEGLQIMRINGSGTSQLQSGTVHNETTEIVEAKVDMPRSL